MNMAWMVGLAESYHIMLMPTSEVGVSAESAKNILLILFNPFIELGPFWEWDEHDLFQCPVGSTCSMVPAFIP